LVLWDYYSVHNFYSVPESTLWFNLEGTVLFIGTFLLPDPALFPKYEGCLLIASIHPAKQAFLLLW